MARVPYADLEGGGEDLQALAARIRGERGGRLLNLYRVLLQSPPLAEGWLDLLTAVRYRGGLDGQTRELAICMVGHLTGAEYEWRAHSRLALQEGLSQMQLDALGQWRESALFDARQSAVLGYAEQMTRQVEVDEATFGAVREHFDAQAIVELTITVAAYNMVTRLLLALQVDQES